jgi:hypothetical protein
LPKIALFPVLLVAACLVAGLYGALHNQISYTVSPAYFHVYKFDQFDIPDDIPGRLGAAVVGFRASWWMGILIGVPVLIIGMVMPDWKTYVSRSLIAFVVVACTALLVGVAALVHACFTITEPSVSGYLNLRGADELAFVRARTMHDFSYSGGFAGIITGSLYLVAERVRMVVRSRQRPTP